MNKIATLILLLSMYSGSFAQTSLTEAVDFHIKTVEGVVIDLFPLLDEQNKIVVIDFFSTSWGPCQTYAPHFQQAYEAFGYNEGNVFFVGINWGSDNEAVANFDESLGLTYPSASGTQGGGNAVFESYEIIAYPTVIVITPDHQIVNQFIDPPTTENITDAVIAAGGIWVSTPEEDAVVAHISVHPNPVNTSGFLSFKAKEAANLQYGIYDMLGKQLYLSEEMYISGGPTKLPLPVNGLENGMYFVRLLINEKLPETIRFIVAK